MCLGKLRFAVEGYHAIPCMGAVLHTLNLRLGPAVPWTEPQRDMLTVRSAQRCDGERWSTTNVGGATVPILASGSGLHH